MSSRPRSATKQTGEGGQSVEVCCRSDMDPINEETHLIKQENSEETKDEQPFRVYKRRWYVLFLFTAIALICNMEWNTWGPISEPCQIVFKWGNWQILFLSSWFAISIILSFVFMTWLMHDKGLRCSVILCALLMTVGKALQVIPVRDILSRTILIHTGQFICMLPSPIALGAPPALSATWFPPHQRTTATAIATLLAYLGISLSFIIGPAMVPVLPASNTTNVTLYDVDRMRDNITSYLVVQLAICGFWLICVLVYFPAKPPTPPSASCAVKHRSHKIDLKALFKDRSYLHLAFLFSVSFGVYFGWMSVFALAVKPFNVDERLAGRLGCTASVAGCLSGIFIAKCVDYVKRQTKTVLIILFTCTTISQLLFSLTCSRIIPYSQVLLYTSIITGGLFFNGTTPLLFEMAIETVYPIDEALPSVVQLVGGNVIYLIFCILFMFPGANTAWMNWGTVLGCGICVPGLLIYRTKFKRLDLDEKYS